ncbi:MAG: hypothetical protein AVDCRST_MAG28-3514, partial [uncultured Rubrobacteraceae bacterium]
AAYAEHLQMDRSRQFALLSSTAAYGWRAVRVGARHPDQGTPSL